MSSTSPDRVQYSLLLLCFHHAGGSAATFNSWIPKLPSKIKLLRVELPGRSASSSKPAYACIKKLMPQLAPELSKNLSLPYIVYGHSLGALVGFEFVRWVRREGLPLPNRLIVAGRRAPQCPLVLDSLYNLSRDVLFDRLDQLGVVSNQLLHHPRWQEYLLSFIRKDLEMSDTYQFEEEDPLACNVTAIRGEKDVLATHDEVAAWQAQSSKDFQMKTFPGAHFFSSEGNNQLLSLLVEEANS